MDDTQIFDELLRRLNHGDDSAEFSPDENGVLLHRFDGRSYTPSLVLHVDAQALGEHLRSMSATRELFPEVSPEVAALQLFLVRLMETVDVLVSGLGPSPAERRHLVPVRSGIRSQAEPPSALHP